MSVTIYFIQEGHEGPIKIGATKQNLYYRIAHMQCGNYRKLQVLGVIEGSKKSLEGDWHRRFAEVRLHGEWFSPTVALLQAIISETTRPAKFTTPKTARQKLETRDSVDKDGWVTPSHRKALPGGNA